ncbi:hypothetical protein EX30DRAFT_370790 [Ascodesmis nigricans]|uniref:Uncharacterized protein n=1 Tax=Ascodesmis nigricans TaxID=341454 RepID=A0A4S2MZP4_9PEZI|nr:hypothetical protein EX30DRAFT_370790 [Ascodesmis nigricans]
MAYATLKPTFLLKLGIDLPRSIGNLSSGVTKQYININSATLTSVPTSDPASPSSPPSVPDTTLLSGGDWAIIDPSSKHARLDVRLLLSTPSKDVINIEYQGIVKLDESIGKVLGGAEDAKTTSWGGAVVGLKIEAGGELGWVHDKVWVASGRFTVGEKGERGVEYTISEVIGEQ